MLSGDKALAEDAVFRMYRCMVARRLRRMAADRFVSDTTSKLCDENARKSDRPMDAAGSHRWRLWRSH